MREPTFEKLTDSRVEQIPEDTIEELRRLYTKFIESSVRKREFLNKPILETQTPGRPSKAELDAYEAAVAEFESRKEMLEQESATNSESIHSMLDALSEGRLSDRRNVLHRIDYSSTDISFNDEDDQINPQELIGGGTNSFWYTADSKAFHMGLPQQGINEVESGQDIQSLPIIVIFSPDNRKLGLFLEKTIDSASIPESLNAFKAGLKQEDYPGAFNAHITFKRESVADSSRWPRWSEVADCIVNIRDGRVTFYS